MLICFKNTPPTICCLRRFGSALFISLFLAGCGGVYYHNVKLFYARARPDITAERYAQTDNVFVLIDKTGFRDFSPDSSSKETVTTEDFSGTLEGRGLSQFIAYYVNAYGGQVAAMRILDKSTDPNAYLDRVKPASVLLIHVLSHAYETEKTHSYEVRAHPFKKYAKDETPEMRTAEDWKFTMSLQLSVELQSYPARVSLLKKTVGESTQRDCTDCKESDGIDDLTSLSTDLMDSVAADVANEVRPVKTSWPQRTIFFERNTPKSVEASTTALEGKWTKATQMWQELLVKDPTDWKAAFDLGIAAENRKDPDAARPWYEKARTLSAQSTEAKNQINFDALLASIPTEPPFAPSTAPVADLFTKRVAVLPFSDETVSIDGPIFIRQAVDAALAGGGYQTIPLEEIDRVLQEHGFSDGAQLVVAKNEDIAKWLGADFLLFANIEKFDDKNIGIYRKHAIEGELKLWEKASKTDIWISRRRVKTTTWSGKLGHSFLAGLLESWAERAAKKPLEAEVLRFVILNLETLPHRY